MRFYHAANSLSKWTGQGAKYETRGFYGLSSGFPLSCRPILNILVPQVIHDPVTAIFPFLVLVSEGFVISFIALHLKQ